jgi:hypothetical protein
MVTPWLLRSHGVPRLQVLLAEGPDDEPNSWCLRGVYTGVVQHGRRFTGLMLALGTLVAFGACSSGGGVRDATHTTSTTGPRPTVTAKTLCNQTYGGESHFADTRLTTVKALREKARRFVPASVLEHALSGRAEAAPAAWCLDAPKFELLRSQGVVGGPAGAVCVAEVATAGPLSGLTIGDWCGPTKPQHAGPPFPPSQ